MPQENKSSVNIAVAAKHDTSYQNDAGGIKASSRWLSEATPPVIRSKKVAGTPARGARPYVTSSSGGVVAAAPQPPAIG